MSQMRDDTLLGMLADRAGVDQDDVGLFDGFDQGKARLLKRGTDQSRIQLVHLAAKAFDVHLQITDFRFHILDFGFHIVWGFVLLAFVVGRLQVFDEAGYLF